ncbi:hypothetical protein SUGI_0957800 [Cryptomeria japonica]|nr:hypothetical protein SUGI_0957800 [Cryptomeria japonica]
MEEEKVTQMLNIVVAVDGSQESMWACEWACRNLLPAHKIVDKPYKFTLLHVRSPLCVSSGPAYILSTEVICLLELDEIRTTQKILKRALDVCNCYNVKAETQVVTGETKPKICAAAHQLGAHLLVMGSHSHGFFIRAIKGSVSDYCTRNAKCPVVVVNKKVFEGLK